MTPEDIKVQNINTNRPDEMASRLRGRSITKAVGGRVVPLVYFPGLHWDDLNSGSFLLKSSVTVNQYIILYSLFYKYDRCSKTKINLSNKSLLHYPQKKWKPVIKYSDRSQKPKVSFHRCYSDNITGMFSWQENPITIFKKEYPEPFPLKEVIFYADSNVFSFRDFERSITFDTEYKEFEWRATCSFDCWRYFI